MLDSQVPSDHASGTVHRESGSPIYGHMEVLIKQVKEEIKSQVCARDHSVQHRGVI